MADQSASIKMLSNPLRFARWERYVQPSVFELYREPRAYGTGKTEYWSASMQPCWRQGSASAALPTPQTQQITPSKCGLLPHSHTHCYFPCPRSVCTANLICPSLFSLFSCLFFCSFSFRVRASNFLSPNLFFASFHLPIVSALLSADVCSAVFCVKWQIPYLPSARSLLLMALKEQNRGRRFGAS